ncbi:hypothetical protein ACJIZ3_016831 [Penstemon smallii]|uniref:Uncharacterized protein n=1 Tax=Penstemon smallii TaxID=265156 RepID=A0ABD3STU8_9LAMI
MPSGLPRQNTGQLSQMPSSDKSECNFDLVSILSKK